MEGLADLSSTARRGAFDRNEQCKDTLEPDFNDPFDSVTDGKEIGRSLNFNPQPDDRNRHEKKMYGIKTLNVWRAG